MVLVFEDMEEKNWITCDTCNNLCKYPSYDMDLKLDECCLCTRSYVRCSACESRKQEARS